ncbi:MAG: polysaccharide deacetylase family protein, partial [Dehalococcoidia bacterium]|nr:polysaccharide deacetylase family protein [Dehalococcoidia bacterium]
ERRNGLPPVVDDLRAFAELLWRHQPQCEGSVMLRENAARPAPPPPPQVRPLAILMYHAIRPERSPITLSLDRFKGQVAALKKGGLRGVTLSEALAARRRSALPPREVAITFDDGYADFATEAWPVLRDAGFRATVFLVTGRLGQDNAWPGQPSSVPTLPLMGRQQVRRLAREGVEFAAHTVTHPRLSTLAPDALARELAFSRQAVEALTDAPCSLFAYPYGDCSPTVRLHVAEHFAAAVGTDPRVAGPAADALCLPRIDATYLNPTGLAGAMYSPMMSAYLALRRAGRGIRNAIIRDR